VGSFEGENRTGIDEARHGTLTLSKTTAAKQSLCAATGLLQSGEDAHSSLPMQRNAKTSSPRACLGDSESYSSSPFLLHSLPSPDVLQYSLFCGPLYASYRLRPSRQPANVEISPVRAVDHRPRRAVTGGYQVVSTAVMAATL
jgi:hypothetical protein